MPDDTARVFSMLLGKGFRLPSLSGGIVLGAPLEDEVVDLADRPRDIGRSSFWRRSWYSIICLSLVKARAFVRDILGNE